VDVETGVAVNLGVGEATVGLGKLGVAEAVADAFAAGVAVGDAAGVFDGAPDGVAEINEVGWGDWRGDVRLGEGVAVGAKTIGGTIVIATASLPCPAAVASWVSS
jgi:hypothetical protein